MASKSGLSFADVLIILAIISLLAALALPRFIKVPDYGGEEDIFSQETTNQVTDVEATNSPAQP